MAIIKCEYCGTAYDPEREICPLCGIPEDQLMDPVPVVAPEKAPEPVVPPIATKSREHRVPNPQPQTRQKTKEPKEDRPKEEGMPKGIMILICIILALTVMVGAAFFLLKIGVFDPKPSESQGDTTLELPLVEGDDKDPATQVAPGEVIACTALSLAYQEIDLHTVGEVATLKAKVEPANTTEPIQWTSSDELVCTVDQEGRITAVGGGVATVTATCGAFTSTSTVTCAGEEATAPPATNTPDAETPDTTTPDSGTTQDFNASLNLTDFTLFDQGETAQLKVSGVPSDVTVQWSIANPAVATLEDGLVTGVSGGTTKVTVKAGDQTLECIVRCNFPTTPGPDSAETGTTGNESLSHSDVTLSVGEQFVIALNGTAAEAVWSVGNTGVCTISSGGTVTATGSGTTEISTTVGDTTLTCVVRVN